MIVGDRVTRVSIARIEEFVGGARNRAIRRPVRVLARRATQQHVTQITDRRLEHDDPGGSIVEPVVKGRRVVTVDECTQPRDERARAWVGSGARLRRQDRSAPDLCVEVRLLVADRLEAVAEVEFLVVECDVVDSVCLVDDEGPPVHRVRYGRQREGERLELRANPKRPALILRLPCSARHHVPEAPNGCRVEVVVGPVGLEIPEELAPIDFRRVYPPEVEIEVGALNGL